MDVEDTDVRGAAVVLGKCRWGWRRGRRPSQGRRYDAYPVANRNVVFYVYLYRYLYSADVYVRGYFFLIPILVNQKPHHARDSGRITTKPESCQKFII